MICENNGHEDEERKFLRWIIHSHGGSKMLHSWQKWARLQNSSTNMQHIAIALEHPTSAVHKFLREILRYHFFKFSLPFANKKLSCTSSILGTKFLAHCEVHMIQRGALSSGWLGECTQSLASGVKKTLIKLCYIPRRLR